MNRTLRIGLNDRHQPRIGRAVSSPWTWKSSIGDVCSNGEPAIFTLLRQRQRAFEDDAGFQRQHISRSRGIDSVLEIVAIHDQAQGTGRSARQCDRLPRQFRGTARWPIVVSRIGQVGNRGRSTVTRRPESGTDEQEKEDSRYVQKSSRHSYLDGMLAVAFCQVTGCRPVTDRRKASTVAQLKRQKKNGNVTTNGFFQSRGRTHPAIAPA